MLFGCIMIAICCILLVKNCVTLNKQNTISDAIHAYHVEVIHNHNYLTGDVEFKVEYNDIEEYTKTLFRLWDWSYKRILPEDKYAIIKPYIKKKH